MITLGRAAYQTELRFNEYYGLSTDEKPTTATGAILGQYYGYNA